MLKPLVHFIRVPDEIDVCLTGKEKVKPSSLCLPGAGWNSSGSELTNFASLAAIKSNSSCKPIMNILERVVRLITLMESLQTDLHVNNQSSNVEEWKLLQTLGSQHLSPSHLIAHEGFWSLCHQGPTHKRVLSHPCKQCNKGNHESKRKKPSRVTNSHDKNIQPLAYIQGNLHILFS